MVDIEEELLDAVHRETIVIPISLPCRHAFEFKTIKDIYAALGPDQLPKCPLCRTMIDSTDPESLPVDIPLQNILQKLHPENYTKEALATWPQPSKPMNSVALNKGVATEVEFVSLSDVIKHAKKRKREYNEEKDRLAEWAKRFVALHITPALNAAVKAPQPQANYTVDITLPPGVYQSLTAMKQDALEACLREYVDEVFFNKFTSQITCEF